MGDKKLNELELLWQKVKLGAHNVSEGNASRVDGSDDIWRFKVYRIPNGPIRIDIQPKEEAPRGH